MFIDLPTLESFLVTFIVTTIRTVLEASPTILGGVIVAAWLRTQATSEKVDSIFSGEGIQGSLRTVLVGMAMPVCAIGVLPVLRELRSLGLSTGKLITLGLSAPLLNPFSLLFGLTVLSFPNYLLMIVVTGLLAIVIGEVSDRFVMDKQVDAAPRPAGLTGETRMRNLLIASSRMLTGRTLIDLSITLAISALTVSLIRGGSFYFLCESNYHGGPAIASLLTITQYVSPARAIIQFGGIEDANLATATGLAIFVCGTGIGGATIFAFLRWFGWRRLLATTIAFVMSVLAITYLSKTVLPGPAVEVAETNALDNLMRPNSATFQSIDRALSESLTFMNTFMIFGSVAIAVLVLAGLFVRIAKINFRDDDPELAAAKNEKRMSKALPASQLGAVSIAVAGVFFCAAAYMFFPGPNEMLDEMGRFQMDADIEVQSGNVSAAVDRLNAWDSAAANLPIGAAIRGSFPTPMQRKLTRDLRSELHDMRALLAEKDIASAKKKLPDLKRRLTEIKETFGGEGS